MPEIFIKGNALKYFQL